MTIVFRWIVSNPPLGAIMKEGKHVLVKLRGFGRGGGRGERGEGILDFKPILSRKHGIIIYYLLLPLEDLIPVYRRPLEEPTLLPAVA